MTKIDAKNKSNRARGIRLAHMEQCFLSVKLGVDPELATYCWLSQPFVLKVSDIFHHKESGNCIRVCFDSPDGLFFNRAAALPDDSHLLAPESQHGYRRHQIMLRRLDEVVFFCPPASLHESKSLVASLVESPVVMRPLIAEDISQGCVLEIFTPTALEVRHNDRLAFKPTGVGMPLGLYKAIKAVNDYSAECTPQGKKNIDALIEERTLCADIKKRLDSQVGKYEQYPRVIWNSIQQARQSIDTHISALNVQISVSARFNDVFFIQARDHLPPEEFTSLYQMTEKAMGKGKGDV